MTTAVQTSGIVILGCGYGMIGDMVELLSVMVGGRWRPGIGDPTVLGWVTTVGYFIAAGFCGANALRAGKYRDGRRTSDEERIVHRSPNPFFWWILTVFMLLMGFNKQLDLQLLVLQVGRQLSKEQGWFAERDAVRKAIILGFAFTSIILTAWLGWTGRRVWRRYILAVSGVAILAIFVLIRASGDRLVILGYRPGKFSMYKVLEVSGILCVAVSAWLELRRLRRKRGFNSPSSGRV